MAKLLGVEGASTVLIPRMGLGIHSEPASELLMRKANCWIMIFGNTFSVGALMEEFFVGVLVTLALLWLGYDFLNEDQRRSKDLPAKVLQSTCEVALGFLLLAAWALSWALLMLLVIVPPIFFSGYLINLAGFSSENWPRMFWLGMVLGGWLFIGLLWTILDKACLSTFNIPLAEVPKKVRGTLGKRKRY